MTRESYMKLIKRFPLRPIRTEEENDKAADVSHELLDRLSSLNAWEEDYLEVLTLLVLEFEEKRWPPGNASPLELVKGLMESNNLTENDFIPYFGTRKRVSDFLSGKKPLTLTQARKLSAGFCLKLEALLRET